MTEDPILKVQNLKTEFSTDRGDVTAVNGVSYEINKGETYGFVGESGAGKSVTALSVLDLVESPGQIIDGEILFKGEDILSLSEKEVQKLRGDEIAMIFQDPMTSLNPSYTIGTQIIDTICEHKDMNRESARERAVELLDDVGIPEPQERIDNYPHQFSGGMRQRALIAMALSCDPDLLIADEPTTALDVTIQAQILDLLRDIQETHGLAIQFITHDMGVIANICDKVGVMYAGKLIETGTLEDVFNSSGHPYTVELMKSIPRLNDPREKLDTIPGNMPDLIETPSGCSFRTRCPHATEECAEVEPPLEEIAGGTGHTSACIRVDEIDFEEASRIETTRTESRERDIGETIVDVDNLQKYFNPESQSWIERVFGEKQYVHAVDNVSLSIGEGETLGLVGESGCGKTTLGRTITQLYRPDEGTVVCAGETLTDLNRRELRGERSEFQVIFQDPFSSLNPYRTVENIIGRPLEIHNKVSSDAEKKERVAELLDQVGLEESHLRRYPHEFSGGQKQRIGIARALAVEPDFIVADEPVSALDVSVQAKILNLLMDLQEEYDLTYLFIAHDLNTVQHISDRIAVMYLGEIVEIGPVNEVFEPPYHPYTEILLSSIPQPTTESTGRRLVPEGEPPSPIDPPSGCRFHTRCPYAMPECSTDAPVDSQMNNRHSISCHLFDDSIMKKKEQTIDEIIEQQSASSRSASVNQTENIHTKHD